MALLAEELVEEWLNRQGFFTIRGIRLGVDEIDLLAVKLEQNDVQYRHIEVQASMRPVSYISKVPKRLQKQGRAPNSAKRTREELVEGVAEWVNTKFRKANKLELMTSLAEGEWSSELIINNVKDESEVKLIESHGIKILRLRDIVSDLRNSKHLIKSASGSDFVDLIQMGE